MIGVEERMVFSPDWITIFFLIVIVLLAAIKYHFNDRLSAMMSLIYSEKYFTEYAKTKPVLFNGYNILFFIVFFITFSLLIFYGLNAFVNNGFQIELSYFSIILLGLFSFLVLRMILGSLLAFIFEVQDEYIYFSLIKISNLYLISIYTLPILLLVAYANTKYYKILIGLAIIFASVLILVRYFRSLQNDRINFTSIFYLFLYLCALEIAPIILVYKLIVS
ncbi:DUF4271 domain-containing protein [Namhaeicola litoreus]|uniref:DUF4271 domain-containing protein n=1 Tax=Namhaeicola litoreus TaxID=1052145 RepID=A0ABW3Y235_9FLAO